MNTKTLIITICLMFVWSGGAWAVQSYTGPEGQFGRIKVSVSSVLPPQAGNFYGPKSAFDGSLNTAWVEGVEGYGVDQWIKLDFGYAAKFKTIYINNGYAKSPSVYRKNSRIKKVRVAVQGGQTFDFTLADTSSQQTLTLPHAVTSPWVKLTILSVYPGSRYMDTCVSEVAVDLEEFNYQ